MTLAERSRAIGLAFRNPDAGKEHLRLQAQQIGTCSSRIVDLVFKREASVNFEAEIKVLQLRVDALIEAARAMQ